jgi:heparosan-N-sulfate-glucuronate 5-epimerase
LGRFSYLQRVFAAYLGSGKSHLTFWHDDPQVNEQADPSKLAEYYMRFFVKADYPGHYDKNGIPMLDYRGKVGLQYNPIAIAQYGLGNYNLYKRTGRSERKAKFLKAANWLVQNLETTRWGTKVWNHHFDWEYRNRLKAPWYSALSQGQGVSVLVRAHKETEENQYLDVADQAFDAFRKDVRDGGVTYTDARGFKWFEESIVEPPTHILNGFMWAAWGVYDYYLYSHNEEAKRLWEEAVRTLKENLSSFDVGFWSLYEQSGTRMKMLASPFYHNLHIVQLKVMHGLTGEGFFYDFAERWEGYRDNPFKKTRALLYKSIFKLAYY